MTLNRTIARHPLGRESWYNMSCQYLADDIVAGGVKDGWGQAGGFAVTHHHIANPAIDMREGCSICRVAFIGRSELRCYPY